MQGRIEVVVLVNDLAPRRGTISLEPAKCTSCMICVRECPVWCIELTAEREHDPDAGPRGRTKLVLTGFEIDFGLCMDCGICVDVCPTDALAWESTAHPASSDPDVLRTEMDELAPPREDD